MKSSLLVVIICLKIPKALQYLYLEILWWVGIKSIYALEFNN